MINANINISDEIQKMIMNSLEEEVKKHIEIVRDEIIAKVMVRVSKHISCQTMGETLVFEIKKLD
jgi:hypothetical protein